MYELTIDGDLYLNGDSSSNVTLGCGSDETMYVQLSINEDGDQPVWRCVHCDEESAEGDLADPELCPGSGKWHPCLECGGSRKCSVCEGIDSDDCTLCDGSAECKECDDDGEVEIHECESAPLHWVNSVGFTADPGGDRVYLDVSVGDPRGCLRMELRRTDDGRTFLHVPHAGMAQPHVPLTDVSPGTMEIKNLSHN